MIMFRSVIIALAFAASSCAADAPPVTVGCLGDSITAGIGASNVSTTAYPAVLQAQLGADFIVYNFGHSAATMQRNVSEGPPYWDTAEFATATALSPDVVVLMLGTNDAKVRTRAKPRAGSLSRRATVIVAGNGAPYDEARALWARTPLSLARASSRRTNARATLVTPLHPSLVAARPREADNWQGADAFLDALGDMTETLAALPSAPAVLVAAPPPLYNANVYTMSADIINGLFPVKVPPTAHAHGAAALPLDVFSALGGANLSFPEYYWDKDPPWNQTSASPLRPSLPRRAVLPYVLAASRRGTKRVRHRSVRPRRVAPSPIPPRHLRRRHLLVFSPHPRAPPPIARARDGARRRAPASVVASHPWRATLPRPCNYSVVRGSLTLLPRVGWRARSAGCKCDGCHPDDLGYVAMATAVTVAVRDAAVDVRARRPSRPARAGDDEREAAAVPWLASSFHVPQIDFER